MHRCRWNTERTVKRMPEVVMQYDLDESGKMVNLVRKEEIVRCKDCKWHEGKYYCRNTDTYGFDDDDYCSLAERKTDEDD